MKKIWIAAGEILMHAELNETVAAREFAGRLPCSFCMSRCSIEYCGTAPTGVYDPLETQTGWKNGDISLGDGWFSIFYSGEEQSHDCRDLMIIGHMDAASLELLRQLPERICFRIYSD